MTRFPLVSNPNPDDDCIICTEALKNARKLECNHSFHLICLSKWIEKGNKNCPICRKDINISMNNSSIWAYGFRLESRWLSWLPNISIRIMRGSPLPAQPSQTTQPQAQEVNRDINTLLNNMNNN
jgi:hypothetical protein